MELLLFVAALVCPLAMGGMMLWMWLRGREGRPGGAGASEEDEA